MKTENFTLEAGISGDLNGSYWRKVFRSHSEQACHDYVQSGMMVAFKAKHGKCELRLIKETRETIQLTPQTKK